MKYLFGLLAFISLSAHAGTAVLTCLPPTKNTDGSTITGTITYNFYRGTSATSVTTKLNATPTTTCTYTDSAAPVGTDYYAATAIVGGQESAQTAVVSKVIAPPVPMPPSGVTIADTTAYYIIQQSNLLAMLPVGTVPASTMCDTEQSITVKSVTYSVVPTSAVNWYGKTHPLVVVASCS